MRLSTGLENVNPSASTCSSKSQSFVSQAVYHCLMGFPTNESWAPAAGPGEVWEDPDWLTMATDIRRTLGKKDVTLVIFRSFLRSRQKFKMTLHGAINWAINSIRLTEILSNGMDSMRSHRVLFHHEAYFGHNTAKGANPSRGTSEF